MKKKHATGFQLSKKTITRITELRTLRIKGGTLPTGPNMTDAPDENNICWAAQ